MSKVSVSDLRENLSYDPETGQLRRLLATRRAKAGDVAGRIQPSSGYVVVCIGKKALLGQRVAWALMTGDWPVGLIEFANGDPADLRWSNLRLAAVAKSEPSREVLMAALDYDPASGAFTWKQRPEMPRRWNTRWANKLAGTLDKDGYVAITVNGSCLKAHRIAVLFLTGQWPPEDVDHIDRDPGNNAADNLRVASRTDNNGNATVRSTTASGLKGAYLVPTTGRWMSRIQRGDHRECLGTFDTPELAHAAYAAAAVRIFGEFARAQ